MGIAKKGLAIGITAVALISAGTSYAQQADEQVYDIPAQDLKSAILAVAGQAGYRLYAFSDDVKGKRGPALKGRFTVEEAIRLLLEGSGLYAEVQGKVVQIRGRSATPRSDVANAAGESSDIIVTGSRIRGAVPSSPVIRASREDIESEGLTDLGSYARSIPQNFSGGQNPGVVPGGGAANQNLNNSSALNLRGLGPDATLTLVNGHRVAYDAISQGVDISAIPLAAIERVEIVADGASALYGSDAVGGVANVILRRDFDGLETSAHFGASTDGGNEQQQYSAVAGKRWSGGGLMAAVDFSHSTAVTARDRSYTATLDDSATLLPSQKQISLVISSHQRLTDIIRLELDAQFNNRNSERRTPFSVTQSAFANGNVNKVGARSYSVTPSVRFALPSEWEASLSATHAGSKTAIRSRRFSGGAETRQGLLIYNNRTDSVELNGEGPVFRAPGGIARMAVGAGYRSLKLDVFVNSTAAGITQVTSDFTGGRDVYFAYGELSIPVVGNNNTMPLIRRLTATGAVRYENYRGVGSIATPKIGLTYEPLSGVTLKSSWGKSFKAQTLFQEFQLREGNLISGTNFVPSNLPQGATVLLLAGGNQNLKPERATTWTTSVAFRPAFIRGLSVEASYFDVHYNDRVATPIIGTSSALLNPIYQDFITFSPTSQQIADAIADLPQGILNQTGQPFDPASVAAIMDNSLRNTARQRIQGVDVAADYTHSLGTDDQLRITAAGSYLDSKRQLSSGQPTADLAGTIFNPPHWRARFGGTWERRNVALATTLSYIGGTLDNRFQPIIRVGAFTTVDTTARIKATDSQGLLGGFDFIISVQNILNAKPSIIRSSDPSNPPYDSANYPSTGRVVGLTITRAW